MRAVSGPTVELTTSVIGEIIRLFGVPRSVKQRLLGLLDALALNLDLHSDWFTDIVELQLEREVQVPQFRHRVEELWAQRSVSVEKEWMCEHQSPV